MLYEKLHHLRNVIMQGMIWHSQGWKRGLEPIPYGYQQTIVYTFPYVYYT